MQKYKSKNEYIYMKHLHDDEGYIYIYVHEQNSTDFLSQLEK